MYTYICHCLAAHMHLWLLIGDATPDHGPIISVVPCLQVTEAQLGASGAVQGSRYTYRPALAAAPPSVATGSMSTALPAPPTLTTPGAGLLVGSSTTASKYSGFGGMGTGMKAYTAPTSPQRATPAASAYGAASMVRYGGVGGVEAVGAGLGYGANGADGTGPAPTPATGSRFFGR